MFEAARDRLAYRRTLKWVRRRQPRPWHPDPARRRVLLVVPAEEDAARQAWRFVEGLGLGPELVLPLLLGPDIGSVSTAFLSRVRVVQPHELDRLGLPGQALREEAWSFEPDVALSLVPGADRAATALVGASPAAFRAGFFAPGAEPFFDLMGGGEGGRGGAPRAGRGAGADRAAGGAPGHGVIPPGGGIRLPVLARYCI